jgi:tyrosinase
MTVIRKNYLQDANSRAQFSQGVNLLKQDFSAGVTTQTLGFGGNPVPVSAYDQFVIWHYVAMNTLTPPGNVNGRNSAHAGPIFTPWHRFMLLLFEQHLRRVLGDPTFALPYWDWAADGDGTPAQQLNSALWTAGGVGSSGTPVTTGPFAFQQQGGFRVFFSENLFTGQLTYTAAGRGLRRQLGAGESSLPTTGAVSGALSESDYDAPDWDRDSPEFRNRLEGWRGGPNANRPGMHNLVHVWIGGDMGLGTSPNDPVFYLNHCNVDRVWEKWLLDNGRAYAPDQTSPAAPVGHRLKDTITSLVTTAVTSPSDMLDVTHLYTYDALPV